jgi:hypothetical protein
VKIQQQDLFHGAALTQVVEHPSFKALNKAPDGKYGHYVLNNDKRLFLKYTTGDGPDYWFTLSKDEVAAIKKDQAGGHTVFAVLVCSDETICAVPADKLWDVADKNPKGNQQVWVRSEAGKSMRFGRGQYELPHVIPHNSFPRVVL